MIDWKKVEDNKTPKTGTIMFYTDCLREPTDMWIGVFRNGKYMSCGIEVKNVTHWAHKPNKPKQ